MLQIAPSFLKPLSTSRRGPRHQLTHLSQLHHCQPRHSNSLVLIIFSTMQASCGIVLNGGSSSSRLTRCCPQLIPTTSFLAISARRVLIRHPSQSLARHVVLGPSLRTMLETVIRKWKEHRTLHPLEINSYSSILCTALFLRFYLP